ncbi:MAG: hypothetical protein Q8L48_38560 [Archangium sp.]|nr:hypothetical protein [Archangium sp.]
MNALVVPLLLVLHAGPTLVSPPWKTVQVPAELAEFYADHLAQALRREGFKVVTASEVGAMLSLERQKALLGCTEEASSCIAELGAAMGADAVLMVNLARLEDLYRGNVKLISARDNSVIAETSVEASGQKGLLGALDDGARRLADATPGVRAKPLGTKRLWWVPAIAAAAGAVTGAVGLVSANVQYTALRTELQQNGVSDDARTRAASGTTTQTIGWVGVGVFAAGLAGLGAVLLFGSEQAVTPSVSVGPSGASVGLGGTF